MLWAQSHRVCCCLAVGKMKGARDARTFYGLAHMVASHAQALESVPSMFESHCHQHWPTGPTPRLGAARAVSVSHWSVAEMQGCRECSCMPREPINSCYLRSQVSFRKAKQQRMQLNVLAQQTGVEIAQLSPTQVSIFENVNKQIIICQLVILAATWIFFFKKKELTNFKSLKVISEISNGYVPIYCCLQEILNTSVKLLRRLIMLIPLGSRQKWINKLLALIKHKIIVFIEFKNTALKKWGSYNLSILWKGTDPGLICGQRCVCAFFTGRNCLQDKGIPVLMTLFSQLCPHRTVVVRTYDPDILTSSYCSLRKEGRSWCRLVVSSFLVDLLHKFLDLSVSCLLSRPKNAD